ncbi:Signal transduction histidine kinase [Asanoa hainanensis]|uniref:histidine kinase n=1 Tax=Asanoa hainanensis TaxID=560556 RepID=A0A239GGU1_9ACTN|nr:sensor histidine kinase [Asanoa hainanensis]SNS67274.1 Signal transduction histidine kinase [Asanoa hainanensis]
MNRPGTCPAAVAALAVAAAAEALVRFVASRDVAGAFLVLLAALAVASTAPLALRRDTTAALVVTAASVVALAGFGLFTVAGLLAQLAAAYRVGRRGALAVAVPLGLPYLVLAFFTPVGVVLAALVPGFALAGVARRVSRADAAHLAAQDAFAGTLVEHTARGERARIARELHDVVAHHISMISVQAENARLTTPGLPPAGAERFAAIGGTARAALTEMRRLLGVLRSDAPAEPERQPQPGLRELAALLDEARDASGSGTRLILRGPPVPLDPGVELAAYRIVQEALTNARRHAPGAAVDVEISYRADGLVLRIRDNGPGPGPASNGGHGLSGMRERAAAVGGRLRTGVSGPAGGFVVEATLPVPTEEDR